MALKVPIDSGSMPGHGSRMSISHHTAVRSKLLHCYRTAPRLTVEASALIEFSRVLSSSFTPGHDIRRRSSADGDYLIETGGVGLQQTTSITTSPTLVHVIDDMGQSH